MANSIKVAVIGVGNCASSLVQGLEKYRAVGAEDEAPGIMHPVMGEYGIGDIEVVAAFDINESKVGLDLSEAILAEPNNTVKFADVPHTGVTVQRGMTHDGIGHYVSDMVKKAPGGTADISGTLQEREVDVVINYLPVGSEEATRWYAEQVLAAKVGFINCIPVFIASGENDYWQKRFRDAGAPIIGDDIKSQVGATIVHRTLARLFMDRGVQLDDTYQLNFGGNTDFLNMLERDRLVSKKISKTQSVAVADRQRDPGRQHPYRAERPRAVADRPQVGLHPAGGHELRGRAAQHRAQAGGVGQSQLRGRGDRRHPVREDREGPGHRRAYSGAVGLLHEVAARPVPRRGGA